ncbi:pyruvate dehydrogenase (acetyl-transferring) E1 component subunit alpha [Pseudolysinimonas kribbensis]
MSQESATVQLLSPEGTLLRSEATERYLPVIDALDEQQLLDFHRQMVVIRRFDLEAGNLQRQGQLALWIPSMGQEAAQVGSGYAARPQDHIFPSYREHVVGRIRGLDPLEIIRQLRGNSHGGWDAAANGNFHLYAIVLSSQTLHATGYAMGLRFDGAIASGDPESDQAVIVYYGDGASSEGDVHESMVFAASYQTPQVFFLQNNQWAISVPVSRQSRTPLYERAAGYGIPSLQIDGNDVLAAYATTRIALDEARGGRGPRFIEAMTYRMGAHTSSDDPTKYREDDEVDVWSERDAITRFEHYLRSRGVGDGFFAEVATEAEDAAADLRTRIFELAVPEPASMFAHVYSEPHPVIEAQREWLAAYEASFGETDEAREARA